MWPNTLNSQTEASNSIDMIYHMTRKANSSGGRFIDAKIRFYYYYFFFFKCHLRMISKILISILTLHILGI